MSLMLDDRVRETTQTTGTGTITLDGAVQGFQSFAVIGNNNTTYYAINRGSEWEVGLGTYYGGTLSRDTIYASSNSGNKVNFSAGAKDVFVTYPAEKSVNKDANNRVLIPYTSGTTNVGSLNVGDATAHTDSGVIAGFTASEPLYLYTSLQNTSASNTSYASYAVNDGGHTAYGELGINNSNYSYSAAGYPNNGFSTPLATFVESYGGPLVLGSWDNQKISMIINGAVSTTDAMTINTNGSVAFNGQVGTAGQILQSNATSAPTWITPSGGTVTSVTGTAPVVSSGGNTPAISMAAATASVNGYLTSTDWTTFNNKGSGTVTSVGGTGTVNGLSLSGTVTSSGNLTFGGTLDLSSPPAIGGTAPAAGKFTTLESTGTASLGTGSTTYVRAIGDASYPGIYVTGGTNTPLVLQPLGTGALQAQKTDSTATGGNARGANAVDWQTARNNANQVASSSYSVVGGGYGNKATGNLSSNFSGYLNTSSGSQSAVVGGEANTASGLDSFLGGGSTNTAAGFFNFIGGGSNNSATSGSAVTTQSGTMNATTAVTLSGSNANIKVGQLVTGTSIANYSYVAAISGTSLTLSQAASGSSTSTLSFYTPHGVVVGGGNNQATGAYSFIGGGGDAGTAANRNVASGDWSVVAGGKINVASGTASFIGGGGTDGSSAIQNTASGLASSIVGGIGNNASGQYSLTAGRRNSSNASGTVALGTYGSTRSINGNIVLSACFEPVGPLGISQSAILVLARQTTDATATILTSDSSAASGTNQVILPNNSAYYFRGEVIAGVTGGGNTKGWYIEGVIKRGSGVGTAALVGTPTVTSLYADVGASTWTIGVTADTTNGGLAVTFTGQASTTIRCVAQIRTTEMTY